MSHIENLRRVLDVSNISNPQQFCTPAHCEAGWYSQGDNRSCTDNNTWPILDDTPPAWQYPARESCVRFCKIPHSQTNSDFATNRRTTNGLPPGDAASGTWFEQLWSRDPRSGPAYWVPEDNRRRDRPSYTSELGERSRGLNESAPGRNVLIGALGIGRLPSRSNPLNSKPK